MRCRHSTNKTLLKDDPGFVAVLEKVRRALDETDVPYIEATPLIKVLTDNGPLDRERLGIAAGLDSAHVALGIARLEALGLVSRIRSRGLNLIGFTASGVVAFLGS